MIKILNLYAGIGGNRRLWPDDEIEVTAVELNPKIAKIYQDFFPNDKVIVADAHDYLLKNFQKFDFIWSSPPCQSHSNFRKNICVRFRGTKPVYPDMKLYQEIVFLKHHFEGKWVVENVKPYYKPLIEGKLIQRHLFWSNFNIRNAETPSEKLRQVQIPKLQEIHQVNLSKYKLKNKRQILRNCVESELGLHIFNCAFKEQQIQLNKIV
jgi:DNA (cytosine-5)-methyltransferase 1|tara:strand:- start:7500 stop:8126 length:627 start_codon:yes stop_codon:yes gene_type:complete